MTYKQAQEFIFSRLPMYQRLGAVAYKKDLTNTLALCAACGHPERELKTIHIAGTNGKGTTTHLIAGALQASGLKTGVYTSPHYKDFRERIKINGQFISPRYICQFIEKYKDVIGAIQPSFFEMTVAMAFCYFRDQKTDVAVIETGLGGRLDSTNVITPLLSVITNISFDHMSMLGNTLEAIAGEKAGIIKPTIPVVIGEKQESVLGVFKERALNQHSPLYLATDHVEVVCPTGQLQDGFSVNIDKTPWLLKTTLDIGGPFQQKNLATACMALHLLSSHFSLDAQAISKFYPSFAKQTKYMGRWQLLSHSPLTIADSAHNEGGLTQVLANLNALSWRQLHIILGFVNDKELPDILALFPKNAKYYFAKANVPRGLDATQLQRQSENHGLHGNAYSSVRKAFAAARRCAGTEDVLFIGGSIFVVAEVL